MHYQDNRHTQYLTEWDGCDETVPIQVLVLSFCLLFIREGATDRHKLTNSIHLCAAAVISAEPSGTPSSLCV